MENYILVHNGSAIILAQKHDNDLAVATNHTVLIDTFENLAAQLEVLNIDVSKLIEAVENQSVLLNQN